MLYIFRKYLYIYNAYLYSTNAWKYDWKICITLRLSDPTNVGIMYLFQINKFLLEQLLF